MSLKVRDTLKIGRRKIDSLTFAALLRTVGRVNVAVRMVKPLVLHGNAGLGELGRTLSRWLWLRLRYLNL